MTVAIRPETRTPGRLTVPTARTSLAALVRQGLREHRRAPLTWGGSLGLLGALVAALYPSIEDSLAAAVRGYPEGLREAFGLEDLTSVEAYLHAEMFSLVVPLVVAFFAIRAMARATSLAEERGYLDTVLATPLSRRLLVGGSFLVTALATAAVLGVIGLLTGGAAALAGARPSLGALMAGTASVWPLAVFFAGVAALVAGLVHRPATVAAVASAVLVAMYVVDVLGRVGDGLAPLRAVSAFRYYGTALRDGIDPLAFLGLLAAGALLAALGALFFERRDLLR